VVRREGRGGLEGRWERDGAKSGHASRDKASYVRESHRRKGSAGKNRGKKNEGERRVTKRRCVVSSSGRGVGGGGLLRWGT